MFFKINEIEKDKYVDMGMINISASFYLEKGDEGWEKYEKEHHVIIPIIPEEGYQGKVDENGNPVDQKDYDTWLASLPTEERYNPFCNHSIQFEADVTEEEILWCFEFALAQTHLNYLQDDLHCNKGTSARVVNQDIQYRKRKAFYESAKALPKEEQTLFIKAELAKCESAEIKVTALKEVDFATVETIETYRVK